MDYISMLNPYSIYYLWQSAYGKRYIKGVINSLLNISEKFVLLNFYNNSFNSVRSYSIFESKDSIVLMDFNLNGRCIDDDVGIINFLEASTPKKIYLLMFNNYKGINSLQNNVCNIFKDNSFMFAENYDKQSILNAKLTKILYQMNLDNNIKKLYYHEYLLLTSNN